MATVAESYQTAKQLADEWASQSDNKLAREDETTSGNKKSSSTVADSFMAGMAASKASDASAAESSASAEDAYSILSSKSKKMNKKPFGKQAFKRAMKTAGLASVKSKLD